MKAGPLSPHGDRRSNHTVARALQGVAAGARTALLFPIRGRGGTHLPDVAAEAAGLCRSLGRAAAGAGQPFAGKAVNDTERINSMGAMIAFELTRRLREAGRGMPARLLLSGCRAPQLAH